MTIQENISLKPYNTFGIDAKARFFCEITSLGELREALELKYHPEKFILSGGSNMLITKDIDALVLYIHIKGIKVEQENANHVVIKVMAGENWHEMVLWTLEHNFGGLENLSLIPGFTGTAPIQNIGAYGVELKDCFVSCEAMDKNTLELKTFTKDDCQFGYRDSYFKNDGKDRYIITSVKFRLTKKDHQFNTSYGAIETEMKQQQVSNPTIKDV
ncbi:MAG: UDP-N-acetylmuramate dehydrogenase, partial [Sediminicola sp.]